MSRNFTWAPSPTNWFPTLPAGAGSACPIEVYRLEAGQWLLLDTFENDAAVRAEPFEAMELELSLLWER